MFWRARVAAPDELLDDAVIVRRSGEAADPLGGAGNICGGHDRDDPAGSLGACFGFERVHPSGGGGGILSGEGTCDIASGAILDVSLGERGDPVCGLLGIFVREAVCDGGDKAAAECIFGDGSGEVHGGLRTLCHECAGDGFDGFATFAAEGHRLGEAGGGGKILGGDSLDHGDQVRVWAVARVIVECPALGGSGVFAGPRCEDGGTPGAAVAMLADVFEGAQWVGFGPAAED